jgi:hypothetical protein
MCIVGTCLTKVPGSDLAACELDAVDSALLARADADHLAVLGIPHGVTLRVLHSNSYE